MKLFLTLIFCCLTLSACHNSFPDLTKAPKYTTSPLSQQEIERDINQLKKEKRALESNER